MFATSFATVLALGASVHAIAFHPQPTIAGDSLMNGWTPKPTNVADVIPELRKRQDDDSLCGYIAGDANFAITCDVGSCVYITKINWFGCCSASNVDSCDIATRCVNYKDISSCRNDPDCSQDNYLTACTDAAEPSCAALYSTVSGKSISNLVCAKSATSLPILASTTGAPGVSLAGSSASPVRATGISLASGTTRGGLSATRGSVLAIGGTSTADLVAPTTRNGAVNTAPTATSTAGAAMQTAKALVGGLVGMVAMMF